MTECKCKSPEQYDGLLLLNGIPAVQELRDLALQMKSLYSDTDDD